MPCFYVEIVWRNSPHTLLIKSSSEDEQRALFNTLGNAIYRQEPGFHSVIIGYSLNVSEILYVREFSE